MGISCFALPLYNAEPGISDLGSDPSVRKGEKREEGGSAGVVFATPEDGFWGGKKGSKYLLRRYLDPLGTWRCNYVVSKP